MGNNIVTVVVTYNRLNLLKECISSLKNQLVPTDIIVVNNGSTDGTKEWLSEQEDIIVITQENEGGAGGFYSGMKLAYEKGYEWVWIMDDDTFPEKKCLQEMSKYLTSANVLCPLVVEGDFIDYFHRGIVDFKRINFPVFQIPLKKEDLLVELDVVPVDFISFVGMLVQREVIEKIGLPIKEYFIFGDDMEYSLRIKKNGFNSLLVKDTCIYHKNNKKDEEFKLKNYLKNDKKINQIKRIHKEEKIPYFTLLGYRNSIINVLNYSELIFLNKIFILIDLFLRGGKSLLKYRKAWLSIRLLYKSYMQGFRKNIDNEGLSRYYK